MTHNEETSMTAQPHQGAVGDARKRLAEQTPTDTANGPQIANLDLDAIRARAGEATEGPWTAKHNYVDDDPEEYRDSDIRFHPEAPIFGGVPQVIGYTDLDEADAEFIAHARTDVLALLAEVKRLTNQLAQPCGSCHPCTNWAAETWRKAGGKLPHKIEVDEAMERLRLVEKALHRGGQTAEIRARDAMRVLDYNGWDFWEAYETGGDLRAKAAEARAAALEATLATVRAEHTRDRERLAAVEALADWHETKAEKALRFRPEVDGENRVMDKAAQVHDDAANRIRAALTDPGETLRARDERVWAEHRREWADYIEHWGAAVGAQPPTIEGIVNALRSECVPFGKEAGR